MPVIFPIQLAPMEGLTDPLARESWTSLPAVDSCTTEFIRISYQLLPEKVFLRDCPELLTEGRTSSGILVALQLLGSDPNCMAENAARAAELGAPSIDLNFGCPAPTVNKNEGGAKLLLNPDRVHRVVEAVRKAVPPAIPVTSKLRLGFMDDSLCLENATAAADGGSRSLTIHCRTKLDMYKPPAKWEWIPRIREHLITQKLEVPIFANGEIWSLADFKRCYEISRPSGIVLGRGLIAHPFLAEEIRNYLNSLNETSSATTSATSSGECLERSWKFLLEYYQRCWKEVSEKYALAKVKQISRLMPLSRLDGEAIFSQVRALQSMKEVFETESFLMS